MHLHQTKTLLPRRIDPALRRFAPAWPAGTMDGGAFAGTGRRLLAPVMWLLLTAVIAQSVLHVVDVAFFDLGIDRFNADNDGSLDGWMGTVATALAAWGAVQLALLSPRLRVPLGALAALCAYLSLDDMLALHEAVARLALKYPLYAHSGYDLWPAVYLPMLCILGRLLLRLARTVDIGTGRLIVGGLCCLAGAVALEALAPVLFALGSDHGQPLYETEVTIEEALELLGWGSIALALNSLVVDRVLARGGAAGRDVAPSADADADAAPSYQPAA